GALTSLVFSPNAPIIGASAAVFGVMLAFAMFWPDVLLMVWGIIPVPARLLVILTTVMTLFFIGGGFQAGTAHFAHLGGYAGAYLYLKWLDRSRTAFKRKATTVSGTLPKVEGWKSIDLASVHEVNREQL